MRDLAHLEFAVLDDTSAAQNSEHAVPEKLFHVHVRGHAGSVEDQHQHQHHEMNVTVDVAVDEAKA